jgi:hypothetical protein
MNRYAWTLAAVVGVLVLATLVFGLLSRKAPPPAGQATASAAAPPTVPSSPAAGPAATPPGGAEVAGGAPGQGSGEAGTLKTTSVVLFFAHPGGRTLAAESREIYDTASPLDRMKQTVVQLIAGPAASSGLLPVLPPETALLDLFLDPEGTAYVDLGRELVRRLRPSVTSEMLAAQSLAHTLSFNYPGIRRVRLLVMGEEIRTLTGHLDLGQGIEPEPSVIEPLESETVPRDDRPIPTPELPPLETHLRRQGDWRDATRRTAA